MKPYLEYYRDALACVSDAQQSRLERVVAGLFLAGPAAVWLLALELEQRIFQGDLNDLTWNLAAILLGTGYVWLNRIVPAASGLYATRLFPVLRAHVKYACYGSALLLFLWMLDRPGPPTLTAHKVFLNLNLLTAVFFHFALSVSLPACFLLTLVHEIDATEVEQRIFTWLQRFRNNPTPIG